MFNADLATELDAITGADLRPLRAHHLGRPRRGGSHGPHPTAVRVLSGLVARST